MAQKKRAFETPRILHDLPLERGDAAHFHFDEFAATLARLIADKKTRTPLTIGVSGAWGSGKTTLLKRVREQLDETLVLLDETKPAVLSFVNDEEVPQRQFRTCRTVWFNAWKYADEDELLVALLRVVLQEMYRDDLISKGAAAIFDPFQERRDVINTVLSWFSIKTPFGEIAPNTGEPRQTPLAEKSAILDQFDEVFECLLAAWVHRSINATAVDPKKGVLVVFIDDLDRCMPEKAVQVLEAVKLFLDKPGCVFVLGAHVDVVCAAVESYYQNKKVSGLSAVDYLDKIIQLRFNLPPVVAGTMQAFLQSQGLDTDMLAQWETLIAAAEINPRRVKAVINDVELQWKMLVNCGQAQGVHRDDFIRWSALMRAAPENFKERVYKIDDPDLRRKFVDDALLWGGGQGDETTLRQFQEFGKDSHRLRAVLRQIRAFGADFDGATLDAFLHLTQPPQKAPPKVEQFAHKPAEEALADLETTGAESLVARPEKARREAQSLQPAGGSRLEVGGLQFLKVPAGKFLMGSKDDSEFARDDEKPQHTLHLPDFWVAQFPVTNAQYAAYVGKGGHPVKDWEKREDHPVINVAWKDAMGFCRWFNENYREKLQGYKLECRLPSEAQWEKAARGEYGNEWPWGDEFDPNRCNTLESGKSGTTPVDAHPGGASPYGALDMAGNVWEWTHTLYKNYPYEAGDGRESETDPGGRVLRGGSWVDNRYLARCAYRFGNLPDLFYNFVGFRLVLSPI